jgi:uncharacterized membrane protein YtjA (UPF0391 family)
MLGKGNGQGPGTLPRAPWHAVAIKLRSKGDNAMLSWAITFLIIAIIAAILGFGGVAGTAVGIAKLLFFVFLALFIISLLMGRRSPPV